MWISDSTYFTLTIQPHFTTLNASSCFIAYKSVKLIMLKLPLQTLCVSAWKMAVQHWLCYFFLKLLTVCLRQREAVVGRVRLDSWSLSGLVGGFLQTPFCLRIRGRADSDNNHITVLKVNWNRVIVSFTPSLLRIKSHLMHKSLFKAIFQQLSIAKECIYTHMAAEVLPYFKDVFSLLIDF